MRRSEAAHADEVDMPRVSVLRIWCAIALAAHVALLVVASREMAPTVDEPGHLAAGVAHWERGTFELYRPNPPLARMLAALPVVAGGPRVDYRHLTDLRSEWTVGHDFVEANGAARFIRDLRRARLVTIAWSVLGAVLVAVWARELWGRRAAALALTLWCFEPTILGHAALATPDVPSAVAGFGATLAFVRYLRAPSWRGAGLAGVLLGIAQLTKFTQLVLYVVWPVLAWGRARPRALLAIAAVSVVVVNAGYGFRGCVPRLGELPFRSAALAGELAMPAPGRIALPVGPDGIVTTPPLDIPAPTGNRFAGGWLGALPLPVPADYVRGLDAQQADFEAGLPSYLGGELRQRGWWYYYLYAAAVKLPLGLWLLGALAVVRAIRRRERRALVVAIPAVAILALVSAKTGFSHHFRYVLPMFPYAIAGVAIVGAERSRLVALGVAAVIASSLAAAPHGLAYFNELAGGTRHGDRHLIDSNLDWGQDLLALQRHLSDHPPDDPLYLAYFGALDPRWLGIPYALPPRHYARRTAHVLGRDIAAPDDDLGPQPGLHAVSVNYLHGARYPAPDGTGEWAGIWFEDYTYFQRFEPTTYIGSSIRLYCIDRASANAVRAELGLAPTDADNPHCARRRASP